MASNVLSSIQTPGVGLIANPANASAGGDEGPDGGLEFDGDCSPE
jgi:hypothetical protein